MKCRTIKTNLLAILMLGMGICQSHAALINEFNPNPTGADPDTQQVELLGTPGAVFNGSFQVPLPGAMFFFVGSNSTMVGHSS